MSIHSIKCNPEYFALLKDGSKTFELRNNDRNYKKGDTLIIHSYCVATGYTGDAAIRFNITFVLTDFVGLQSGFCILSLVKHD